MTENKIKVCLANDSFPPQIDGVANTIKNYADVISKQYGDVIVTTPSFKHNFDEFFPYPIVRYPSIKLSKTVGYRAGYPFSQKAMEQLVAFKPDIIHSHCPMVSQLVCRELRTLVKVPMVFTYHTKFDIDIKKCLKLKLLQNALIDIMINNIEAADEVWVVSKGAGDNLKSLGYSGECVVMPNGVDMKREPCDEKIVEGLKIRYGLYNFEGPIFLSVGRLKWYKGHKLTLDALRMVRNAGVDFRMLFVGSGSDEEEIKKYSEDLGLSDVCIFTGSIQDREVLRNFYFLADAFVFPSTYDTNGIVVREAAACNLGSILIENSCAAEGITDGDNGFIVKEEAPSIANCMLNIANNRALAKKVGQNAANEIYLSWDDAIAVAKKRYDEIIERGITTVRPNYKVDNNGIEFVSTAYKAFEKVKEVFRENDSDED